MFLKSLSIHSTSGLIRQIQFHKGLNLIVDETKTSNDSTTSGNNVGKTTLIRLINFCFGGDGSTIYKDPEFKKSKNTLIESFLTNNEVVITLVLKEDLSIADSKETVIRRNFLKNKRKLQELNGHHYGDDSEFDLALKQTLLNFSEVKPTFKQIRAKNIRDDAERMENTVKVLDRFTKDVEYEALYLFWLGVPNPSADKKQALYEQQAIELGLLKRLRKTNDESKILQFLAILENDIKHLETVKNNFNINETYQEDIDQLAEISAQLNELSTRQTQLELRKELINESRESLENDKANPQTEQIATLYAQAKVLIPNLQKTYEDTVYFHNQMIEEKVRFITQELPRLDNMITDVKNTIAQALVNERELKEKLKKSGLLEDLQPIIAQLNSKYEQKGQLTEQQAQIKTAKTELDRINQELSVLDEELSSREDLIQSRVKIFNTYFASITEKLYGEKFALSAPQREQARKGDKFYTLQIDSVSGRLRTGKKKGEIAAFDIALIKFSDEIQHPCLHFIIHDQMEVVDHNQMISLAREVEHANCQFIVPILRDKLPRELNKEEYQIVSLSERDRLFRV